MPGASRPSGTGGLGGSQLGPGWGFSCATGNAGATQLYWWGNPASSATATTNSAVNLGRAKVKNGRTYNFTVATSSAPTGGNTVIVSVWWCATMNGTYTEIAASVVTVNNASGSNFETTVSFTIPGDGFVVGGSKATGGTYLGFFSAWAEQTA